MARPKKSIKLSFKPIFLNRGKRRFTPTTNRNNAGNIGHPALLNNAGVIKVRIKRKND